MSDRSAIATQVFAANGEGYTSSLKFGYQGNGTIPAVVHSHGGGSNCLEPFVGTDGWYKPNNSAARAGFPTVTTDMGGTWEMGNDNSITKFGQAVTYMQASLGAKSGGVIASGSSMGFLAACNWARQNKANVLGIMGFVGGLNMQGIYNQNGPPESTYMDTAYGGHTQFLAALPTHDPYLYGATDLAGIPLLFVYSTDEAGQGPTWQAQFVAAMKSASPGLVTSHTQTGGHSLANTDPHWISDWLTQFR